MLKFVNLVKFLGVSTRSGQSNGKPWEMTEAMIFVPDLGRVKVAVRGKVSFPEVGAMINLALSVDQGKFQAISLVWDEQSVFQLSKAA